MKSPKSSARGAQKTSPHRYCLRFSDGHRQPAKKTSIYRIIIFTNWSCCCCGARRVVANTLGKLLCTNNTNQSSPGPGGVVDVVRKTPPGETTASAVSRENGAGSPGTSAFAVCVLLQKQPTELLYWNNIIFITLVVAFLFRGLLRRVRLQLVSDYTNPPVRSKPSGTSHRKRRQEDNV